MKNKSNSNSKDSKLSKQVIDSILYLEKRMGEIVIVEELVKKSGIENKELLKILSNLQKEGKVEILRKGFVRLNKTNEKFTCTECKNRLSKRQRAIATPFLELCENCWDKFKERDNDWERRKNEMFEDKIIKIVNKVLDERGIK